MSADPWIDVEAELEGLQESFDRWLESLPPFAVPASQRTLERLALRRRGKRQWTTQFSPLVTLYPLLHAEILGPSWLPQARRATVAHLLLLIHTFLEDRYLDAEVRLDRHELLFAKLALNHATDLLLGLGSPGSIWPHLREAVADHAAAQAQRYHPTDDEQVFEVVAGRAALGRVAALCLLEAAGLDAQRLDLARRAFDGLVVGMQWEDDIKDLDLDLESGSENLVLRCLELIRPSRGDSLVEGEHNRVGALETSFLALGRELERCLQSYRHLGALTLVGVLEDRVSRIDQWRLRVLDRGPPV